MLLDAQRSCLLVVDVQEILVPAMADGGRVIKGAALLMGAANRLGIPVVVSEQYPKGLGPTVAELRALAPDGAALDKVHFSCAADPGIKARLDQLARPQVVIVGIEAHVCVLQTAMQLLAEGREVFVVADATSSRTEANHALAMNRLAAAGAGIVAVEMVVFEWLQRAGTPEFKELSKLVK